MVDDVLVNKAAAIERAVARVREEHQGDDSNLTANQTRQVEPPLAERLKKMVGFRTVAVHDYQRLSIEIVRHIVRERLDDLLDFARMLVRS